MPAGPTKGRPARSSWSPGCSPTNTIAARLRPFAKDGLRRVLPQADSRGTAAPACAIDASDSSCGDAGDRVLRCVAALLRGACRWHCRASQACAALAAAMSAGSAQLSGRLRQYFFGMCWRIAVDLEARRIEDAARSRSARDLRARRRPAHRCARRPHRTRASAPSQCALCYGVRIDQREVAKRRTKNGAAASTM